jgi:hypothetical protein
VTEIPLHIAKAAISSGAATHIIKDFNKYKSDLRKRQVQDEELIIHEHANRMKNNYFDEVFEEKNE